jgi:hypothetical protein
MGNIECSGCEWEFPEFHDSSLELQCIISDCTKGSPDWAGPLTNRLVRVDTKTYPKGRTGHKGEPQAPSRETFVRSKAIWTARLKSMDRYLEAKLAGKRAIIIAM